MEQLHRFPHPTDMAPRPLKRVGLWTRSAAFARSAHLLGRILLATAASMARPRRAMNAEYVVEHYASGKRNPGAYLAAVLAGAVLFVVGTFSLLAVLELFGDRRHRRLRTTSALMKSYRLCEIIRLHHQTF